MKKYIATWISILFIVSMATAIEVDKAEIESAGSINSVVFKNYTGPHKVINTIDQINGIGTDLAKIKEGNRQNTDRYAIIHAVNDAETEKFDADILILGKNALIDHIDNLRRIIASYLTAAYGYTREDAETIAVFVTVYNAVYRNNMEVFNNRYKNVVMQHLVKEKAGLSVNYEEWAGNTQILIPLFNGEDGKIVDTGVVSDKEVIKSLQEEPNKGIPERKNLVTIKEKEAETAQEKAETAQEKAVEAKKEVAQKTEQLQEAKKEEAKAQEAAKKEPQNKELQKKAEEAEKTVKQQEEKVLEAQKNVETLEKKAEAQQTIADKKQTEAQKDRIEIAKDQQKIIRENANLDNVIDATYGLKITDKTEYLSSLVLVDTKTGKTVKESPVTVIRGRTIYAEKDYYIAIAGTDSRNSAIRLVKLDTKKMEIFEQSAEFVAKESVLTKDGNNYYVVIKENTKYYLGRYNKNLELLAKSNVDILPESPVTVSPKGVLVTDTYGFAKLLKTDTLEGIE